MRSLTYLFVAVLATASSLRLAAQDHMLPTKAGSVKFGVMGDTGTGDAEQYDVATQMARYYQIFPFSFVIMLGDNMYGSDRPQDYDKKFVKPYKALIDAKVEFHAALGNHDDPNQRFYKPFNMGGNRYNTFKKGNVRFFVLDSNYLDPDQIKWLEKELQASGSDWKIAYFHHPLYTTASRGPEVELRAILEPLFVKYGVDVVFNGHEHVYERMKPQQGIYYFTAGGGAKLSRGDTRTGSLEDVGYTSDRSFMLVEIDNDKLYFQTVNRTGATVDKGEIERRGAKPAPGDKAPPGKAPQPKDATAKPPSN
ncbi:MAG: metallophosphoesterase [Gemmatimonadota bacterium]